MGWTIWRRIIEHSKMKCIKCGSGFGRGATRYEVAKWRGKLESDHAMHYFHDVCLIKTLVAFVNTSSNPPYGDSFNKYIALELLKKTGW